MDRATTVVRVCISKLRVSNKTLEATYFAVLMLKAAFRVLYIGRVGITARNKNYRSYCNCTLYLCRLTDSWEGPSSHSAIEQSPLEPQICVDCTQCRLAHLSSLWDWHNSSHKQAKGLRHQHQQQDREQGGEKCPGAVVQASHEVQDGHKEEWQRAVNRQICRHRLVSKILLPSAWQLWA